VAGDQPDDLEKIRQLLIRLLGRPKARINAFTDERPTEWRPTTVRNPVTGMCFSVLESWHFAKARLEGGCKLKLKVLDHPPGCKAYEFEVVLEKNMPPVYIKLEPRGDKVYGRSFHYSVRYRGVGG
jgi:hypothetical protein